MKRVALGSRAIWTMPVALAVLSLVGLLSALLGDAVWDMLSWLALGVPVAVMLWCAVLRR